jgi:hypothetical protein
MTAKKLDEKKNIQEPSLRRNVVRRDAVATLILPLKILYFLKK